MRVSSSELQNRGSPPMRAKLSRPAKPESHGIDRSMRFALVHSRYTRGAVVVRTRISTAGASRASAKRRSRWTNVRGPADLCVKLKRIRPVRSEPSSALEYLLDPRLRGVERILRFRLTDQRRLNGRSERVADCRPLRNARAPIDVGVLVERIQRRLHETRPLRLHGLHELGRLPQRGAIHPRALARARELPRR